MKTQNWQGKTARFLTAQTISLFGSSLTQYAIVWYITLSTSSGKMLTISTLCGFVPQILISLFAGVWIDRYNRKKLIILADSVIALSTLALAVSFLTGHGSLWLLFAALAVRSAGTGIQTPAVNAVLPQLVPKERLMRVNGLNSTLTSLTTFLSPAASGAILSFAPLEAVLFIDVVTAVIGVSITSFLTIPPYERRSTALRSSLSTIFEGFSYLKNHAFVRRLLGYQFVVLFLVSPAAFLTPLMVSRSFGPEVWRLTVSEMAYSLGMVLGGALIALWGGFAKRTDTTLLAGGVYGTVMIGLGASPFFLLYLLLNLMIGVSSPCYSGPMTVSLQERVEPDMQGRVFSLMQISTSCALPLGMALFGPLSDTVPVQWILMGAGALILLFSLLAKGVRYLDRE